MVRGRADRYSSARGPPCTCVMTTTDLLFDKQCLSTNIFFTVSPYGTYIRCFFYSPLSCEIFDTTDTLYICSFTM